jgi:hypothetical protein
LPNSAASSARARAPSSPAGVVARTPRSAATRSRRTKAARDELVEREGLLEIDSVAARDEADDVVLQSHLPDEAGQSVLLDAPDEAVA